MTTQATISGKIIRAGSMPLSALAAGLEIVPVNHAASPYSLAAAVASCLVCDTSGGAIAVDLPPATGSGNVVWVFNSASATATTVTPAGSDTITGLTSASIAAQYGAAQLIDVAAGLWAVGSQEPVSGGGGGGLTWVSSAATALAPGASVTVSHGSDTAGVRLMTALTSLGTPVPQVPVMTSDTVPSGTVTSSSGYGSAPDWQAFAPGTVGWLTNGTPTGWIQYELPMAVVITSYNIAPVAWFSFPSSSPGSWTLQGSNDALSWTTLDTQTYASSAWDIGSAVLFEFVNTTAYLYYKLNVTGPTGGPGYVGVGSWQLNASINPVNEQLTIGSSTVDVAGSSKITTQFGDGTGANTATETTFTNRYPATLAVVAQVGI